MKKTREVSGITQPKYNVFWQSSLVPNKPLIANTELSLGNFPGSSGNQSEVEVVFELPATAATFGLIVMGGGAATATTSTSTTSESESASRSLSPTGGVGTYFYVDYVPPAAGSVDEWNPHTVQVGAGAVASLTVGR